MIVEKKPDIALWQPHTSIGLAVKEGKITSISDILRKGHRISEPEIVDALVPNLEEKILGMGMVQRMHESGRRVKFRTIAAVGNRDGVVGVAHASSHAAATSVQKAVTAARLNIIEVARGCGSWECGCGRHHSMPFEVTGQSSNVYVTLKPAPRGLGLAAAEVPKIILRLAGIKDVWTSSRGKTRTTLNFAMATFDALKQTVRTALRKTHEGRVVIGQAGEQSG